MAEIGALVRAERLKRGLSQGALAELAGLSRETVNRLEHGTAGDLGAAKLATLLAAVGLDLTVQPRRRTAPDYIYRATISANVSHRERLHADELVQALLTGRSSVKKRPLVRAAIEEASPATRRGLIEQVAAMAGDRSRVERAAESLAPGAE